MDLPAAQVPYALVDGQVMVADDHGVDLYDAVTGAPRWQYHDVRGRVSGRAVVGEVLAVSYDTGYVVALDAASGRILWRRTGKWRVLGGSGGVVVADDGHATADGMDARTARHRWSRRFCRPPEESPDDTDGSLMLLPEACREGGVRVAAVAPSTGGVHWRRTLDSQEEQQPMVRGGVTLLPAARESFTLVAADGRQILGSSPRRTCGDGCSLLADGGHAIVYHSNGYPCRQLTGIGVRGGDATTIYAPYCALLGYQAVALAGGRAYAVHPDLADLVVPAGLDVIDPATMRIRHSPLPFAGRYPDGGPAPVDWMAAAGGRLYVSGTDGLTAYGPARSLGGPPELGGVPATDWPDACRLASAAGPGSLGHATGITIGTVKLQRTACTLTPASGGVPVSVSVDWVAPTPRQAAALLGRAAAPVDRPVRLGDQAFQHVLPTDGPHGGEPDPDAVTDRLVIRVGRFIVSIDGSPSTAVARSVVAALRTLR